MTTWGDDVYPPSYTAHHAWLVVMTKQYIFRVKDLERFRAWMDFLNDHQAEVVDTLIQEHASREMFTLFEIDGEHYVVSMNDFYDTPVRGDDRELNTKHREILRETLERIGEGTILLNIQQ